jgi:glyoxylase-like metal-dependent hydrolase (beta-lactamase superfamily II)
MRLISCCAKTGFANTYVVGSDAAGEAALIDPGHFPASLLNSIEQAGLEVTAVLLTHGHHAHSAGLATVLGVYRARVYAHAAARIDAPCRRVRGGDTISLGAAAGGHSFEVIELPGHAADCLAFRTGDLLFTGDALLAGATGSTPTAAARATLVDAIRERILCLPDRLTILPGHGPPTTVGAERALNPALR